MASIISSDELLRRLIRARHHITGDPEACSTDAGPTPETIVTVGLNLDPTLKPEYRQRYFACLLESEKNPVPVIQYEPLFALAERFRRAAEEHPAVGEFVDGPFRWVLHRLEGRREVLLWPRSRKGCPGGTFENALKSEALPELEQRLGAITASLAGVGALVLDTIDPANCGLVWEVANHVRNSITDFYLSEPACSEVYVLHHHEMVQALVPDDWARHCLVEELECWDDVLEDCSGYEMEWDDKEDE
jgi:hypothetical protein